MEAILQLLRLLDYFYCFIACEKKKMKISSQKREVVAESGGELHNVKNYVAFTVWKTMKLFTSSSSFVLRLRPFGTWVFRGFCVRLRRLGLRKARERSRALWGESFFFQCSTFATAVTQASEGSLAALCKGEPCKLRKRIFRLPEWQSPSLSSPISGHLNRRRLDASRSALSSAVSRNFILAQCIRIAT